MSEAAVDSTQRLHGLTIVAFESRMTKKMGKLLEREGAIPLPAPSMQEIPLAENSDAFRFFEQIEAGSIDVLVLMTGVGTRTLVQTLETRYEHGRIIDALNQVKIVVRGPKPTTACEALKIRIDYTVPEPNTWR